MASLVMRFFLPNPRQTNLAVVLGFAALFVAFYLRNFILDSRELEAACLAGIADPKCFLRRAAIDFRDAQIFGGIALIAAGWHLWKPDFRIFLLALAAAVPGLLLSNTAVSALAAGLLIISFARPVPAPAPTRERAAGLRTTAPASSKAPR